MLQGTRDGVERDFARLGLAPGVKDGPGPVARLLRPVARGLLRVGGRLGRPVAEDLLRGLPLVATGLSGRGPRRHGEDLELGHGPRFVGRFGLLGGFGCRRFLVAIIVSDFSAVIVSPSCPASVAGRGSS